MDSQTIIDRLKYTFGHGFPAAAYSSGSANAAIQSAENNRSFSAWTVFSVNRKRREMPGAPQNREVDPLFEKRAGTPTPTTIKTPFFTIRIRVGHPLFYVRLCV